MPSRRTKSVAVNERISEAQKARTRLACRVCRSRRIKCDGQKGICGRCRQDKRTDCSYENVGSAERMAGRQRKRALRKQHTPDGSASSATEQGNASLGGGVDGGGGNQSSERDRVNWVSPTLTSTRPPIIVPSPRQAHNLIQNHASTSNINNIASGSQPSTKKSGGVGKKKGVNLTSISSSLSPSTTHRNEESRYGSSFLTSLPSDSSPEDVLTSGYPGGSSWVMSPAHLAIDQHAQPIPHINQSTMQQSTISNPSHPSSFIDYQSTTTAATGGGGGIDPSSVDSLWRVYDWQYRCNSGIPSQYPQYPPHASSSGATYPP